MEFGVRFMNVVVGSCDNGVLLDGVGVLGVKGKHCCVS